MSKTTKLLLLVFIFMLLVVGVEVGYYFYLKSRPDTELAKVIRNLSSDEAIEAQDLEGTKIVGRLEEILPGEVFRITTSEGKEILISPGLNFVEPKFPKPETEEAGMMNTDEIVRLRDLVGRENLEFDFQEGATWIYY